MPLTANKAAETTRSIISFKSLHRTAGGVRVSAAAKQCGQLVNIYNIFRTKAYFITAFLDFTKSMPTSTPLIDLA